MQIEYLAHSCFLFTTPQARLMTDPYGPDLGYQMPYRPADMVTVSHNHPDHNYIAGVTGKTRIFSQAGSFNYQGIELKGILSRHGGENSGPNLIFVWEMEGLKIAHLGDLGEKLSAEQLEALGKIDVLLLPVGGGYTVGPQEAKLVMEQIRPGITIPMHYRTAQSPGNPLKKVNDFCALFPKIEYQRNGSLELKAGELEKESKILVLNNIF